MNPGRRPKCASESEPLIGVSDFSDACASSGFVRFGHVSDIRTAEESGSRGEKRAARPLPGCAPLSSGCCVDTQARVAALDFVDPEMHQRIPNPLTTGHKLLKRKASSRIFGIFGTRICTEVAPDARKPPKTSIRTLSELDIGGDSGRGVQ